MTVILEIANSDGISLADILAMIDYRFLKKVISNPKYPDCRILPKVLEIV